MLKQFFFTIALLGLMMPQLSVAKKKRSHIVYAGANTGLASLVGKGSFIQQLGAPTNLTLTIKKDQSGSQGFFGIFLGYFGRVAERILIGPEVGIDFSYPFSVHKIQIPPALLAPASPNDFQQKVRQKPVVAVTGKIAVEIAPGVLPYFKMGAEFSGFSANVFAGNERIGSYSRYTPGFLVGLGVIFLVSPSLFISAEGSFTAFRTVRFPDVSLPPFVAITHIKSISQTQCFQVAVGYVF